MWKENVPGCTQMNQDLFVQTFISLIFTSRPSENEFNTAEASATAAPGGQNLNKSQLIYSTDIQTRSLIQVGNTLTNEDKKILSKKLQW